MTRIHEGTLIIETEPPQTCELCGKIEETRPYGPNGEEICVECGHDEEGNPLPHVVERFHARIEGISNAIDNT